jgi:hypothetical protein
MTRTASSALLSATDSPNGKPIYQIRRMMNLSHYNTDMNVRESPDDKDWNSYGVAGSESA